MASSLVFTDSGGLVTLTNGKTAPADRFSGWTPVPDVVKAESQSMATGQPYPFVFSTRYVASFTLPKIPRTSQANVIRLIAWLESGGVVTVNTGDAASRQYTSCYLAAGTHPQFTMTDSRFIEYSLTLTLINTAGAAMLCQYA